MNTLFRSTRRSAIAAMAIALCIGGWSGVAQAADPKTAPPCITSIASTAMVSAVCR